MGFPDHTHTSLHHWCLSPVLPLGWALGPSSHTPHILGMLHRVGQWRHPQDGRAPLHTPACDTGGCILGPRDYKGTFMPGLKEHRCLGRSWCMHGSPEVVSFLPTAAQSGSQWPTRTSGTMTWSTCPLGRLPQKGSQPKGAAEPLKAAPPHRAQPSCREETQGGSVLIRWF